MKDFNWSDAEELRFVRAREEEREAIMATIRAGLYRYGDNDLMAAKCGKSKSCIHAIRSGRVRWPRHETLFALIYWLDLKLTLTERFSNV